MDDVNKRELIAYIKAVLINNGLPEDTKYEDLPAHLKPQIMRAREGLTTISKTNLEISKQKTIRVPLKKYESMNKIADLAGYTVDDFGEVSRKSDSQLTSKDSDEVLNFNDASSKGSGMQYTKNDGHYANVYDDPKIAA